MMKSPVKVGVTAALSLTVGVGLQIPAWGFEDRRSTALTVTNDSRDRLSDSLVNTTPRYTGKASWVSGTAKNITPAPSTAMEIATLLPSDTPMLALVNTRGQSWSKLRQFHMFQMASDLFSQFMPSNVKFDYAAHVDSWLGDRIAIAFLAKKDSKRATFEESGVIVASIEDKVKVESVLNFVFKGEKRGITRRFYKGVTILEMKVVDPKQWIKQSLSVLAKTQTSFAPKLAKPLTKPLNKTKTFAIALLPNHIVAGYSGKTIEQIVDLSESSTKTLAQNPEFQKTIENPRANKALFAMYQDPGAYMSLVKDLVKDPSLSLPSIDLSGLDIEQFKRHSSVNMFITIEPEGLRLQANGYHQTPASKDNISTTPTSPILARMPAATYSALTSRNLNQQWQTVTQDLSKVKELKDGLKWFRDSFREATKLDFDRDIVSWMDSEYALFFYPTKGGFLNAAMPNFNLGVGVAVQTKNRTAADTTVKKIEGMVKSIGAVVNTLNMKELPVTSWGFGNSPAESLLAYSWMKDDTLILTTGSSAIADLVPQPKVTLPSTYNFTTATNPLARPNNGYFYVNTGSLLSWAYSFVPMPLNQPWVQKFKEGIGSIYSFSSTTAVTSEREQFDMLVVLAPNRKLSK